MGVARLQKGRRVAALSSIRSAASRTNYEIINISRASNHKAQLAAERGGAGKLTKMHYVRVIQSDWCICIPECKLLM